MDDLADRSVAELLSGYAATLADLRRRGVVRSNNAPAGDYAEWLVKQAVGGQLVENFSVKSYDIDAPKHGRIQVKARVVSNPPTASQLQTSPFRSWDFDLAAFVLLDSTDYTVRKAALVPRHVVEGVARRREHINGSVVFMTPALLNDPLAEDLTEALQAEARSRDVA
jgi:hypothetical protein